MPQAVVVLLCLVLLVSLPCLAVLSVILVGGRSGRHNPPGHAAPGARSTGPAPDGPALTRREWVALRQLERSLASEGFTPQAALDRLGDPGRMPIERIATHLRRLSGQRRGVATWSPMWRAAVHQAYDDQLRSACRCLNVRHRLDELRGLELELERLRVERELRAAGLAIDVLS